MDVPCRFFVATVSIAAAVSSGLQTFLRLGDRAERHRAVAIACGAVRRQIELIRERPAALRGEPLERVGAIRTQLDASAQEAPDLPAAIWNKRKQVHATGAVGRNTPLQQGK